MTQQQETGCVLRLFGAQSTAVGKTVENFPPQWRAAAQWKSRGAETLVALQAQSPSGLKKAAQALRQAFSADLYGAGETTLPAAVVEALERHDKLLICADAAAGALLEARLENLPGAEKVFDFGAVSYANPKTGPLIEKRARARLPKDCTDPLRQALARLRLPAAWWGQISPPPVPSGKVTVCWCSAAGRAAFCAPSRRGRTLPSGCWISSGARRQTSLRLKGQASCLPAGLQRRMFCPAPSPGGIPCAGCA